MNFKSLFEELKRRNIYKVAIAYGVTGWVIVQMASIAANTFGAPAWVMKMLIIIILLGFPIALILAWAFEITPEGIKRTRKVSAEESITRQTGSKLNYWIIGFLSVALVFLLVDRLWIEGSSATPSFSDDAKAVPTVAVLPFQDFSSGGDQEWFSDGLTEELLNSLARLQGLQVAARTSSFHFKNTNIPIQQIADSLGVEHVVEGSVRRADSTMRITAQLIRASDGFHEWSKTYERDVKDVFKVQEDISENIASVLDIYLDDEARSNMFAFGTRDVEAYNAFLKGKSFYNDIHQQGITDSSLFTKAMPFFKKAIQLDPDFAAPYYLLADPYTHFVQDSSVMQIDSLTTKIARSRIFTYLDEAIDHTSDSGEKLMYQLERTFLSNDWSNIPAYVEKLRDNPEALRAFIRIGGGWTRTFLAPAGYARLQYQLSQNALQRDPLEEGFKGSRMQALMSFGTADSIMAELKKLSQDNRGQINSSSEFFIYTFIGKLEKADSVAQSVSSNKQHPSNIFLQAVRGDTTEARKNFEAFDSESFKNSFFSSYFHYILGNHQKANNLAMQIDTTALGPQKLLLQSAKASGGFLPFNTDSMPNLGPMLKQAGAQVQAYDLEAVQIPRIVQAAE